MLRLTVVRKSGKQKEVKALSEIGSDRGLFTVEELAQVLAMPKSWVYMHAAAGTIPHVKVGRYVRFRLDEVYAWLAGGGQ